MKHRLYHNIPKKKFKSLMFNFLMTLIIPHETLKNLVLHINSIYKKTYICSSFSI